MDMYLATIKENKVINLTENKGCMKKVEKQKEANDVIIF